MSDQVHLVIAACEPLILAGLRTTLETAGDLVYAGCTTFHTTCRALTRYHPDVLIADEEVAQVHNARAFETLRAASPNTQIVILERPGTTHHPSSVRERVASVLPATVPEHRVLASVRAIAHRAHSRDAHKAERGTASPARPQSPLALLTVRERQIAMGVARGQRNRQIAEGLRITPGTVKLHLHRIYGKLHVNGRLDLFRKLAREADLHRHS